jgi:hypothetical protein
MDRHRWVRIVGAATAAAISAVVFALGLLAGGLMASIGLAGLILALPMGWWLAPRAAQPGGRAVGVAALVFAGIATTLGAAIVAILRSGGDSAATGSLLTFGLVALGLPMFAVLLALSLLWATIVRAATETRSGGPRPGP